MNCPTGKMSFNSRKAALQALDELKRKERIGLREYLCEDCRTFHVGHKGTPIELLFKLVRSQRNQIKAASESSGRSSNRLQRRRS